MSNTRKKPSHKFDDEKTIGRNGKHSKHANNHRFHGLRIINWVEYEEVYDELENNVKSSINKQ